MSEKIDDETPRRTSYAVLLFFVSPVGVFVDLAFPTAVLHKVWTSVSISIFCCGIRSLFVCEAFIFKLFD